MNENLILIILGSVLVISILYILLSRKRKGQTWSEASTRTIYVFGVTLTIGEIVLLGPMLFKGDENPSAFMAIFLPIMTLVATVVIAMLVGMVVQIFEGAVRPTKRK